MSLPSEDLNPAQAQLLMSQLIDGEISPENAAALQRFLEKRPEAIDWMETLTEAAPQPAAELPADQRLSAIAAIQQQLASAEAARPRQRGVLLRFPAAVRSLAAAAALAVGGALLWLGLDPSSNAYARSESAVVEFVATDLPNASTFVYTDEESGWTVVWVEPMEPLPQDRG